MAMDANAIEALILEALPDAKIKIEDLRGDGEHYAAYITSASFAGKSRIEQHRMVQRALKDSFKEELHALAIQTIVEE